MRPENRDRVTRRWAAALTAATLGSILLTTGCQMARPTSPGSSSEPTPAPAPAPAPGSTVTSSEYSTLDAAGVQQIESSRQARLDMTGGELLKSAVRLTDDSRSPEISTLGAGKIALTVAGPSGEIRGQTDRIRFLTTDFQPDVSQITYFLTADSREEYFALIRDGVERYGIESRAAEGWITSISATPEDQSSFALGPGTATGLNVSYDLRYDGSKDVQVIIVHVSPVH